MTKGMKRLCKGVCLLLVLAVVGIGIYQAYFFFLKKAYPMEYQDIIAQKAEKYQVWDSIAFMGIEDNKLEMLFIAPDFREKGLGKKLLLYGIENYQVYELV